MGFPGGLVVKNLPANAGDTGLTLGHEDFQRRKQQPMPIFLLWKSHEQIGHNLATKQ